MLPRSVHKRVRRLEAWVKHTAEEKSRREAKNRNTLLSRARNHAAEVVALILYGEVDIHEPLEHAYWRSIEELGPIVGAETEQKLRESGADDSRLRLSDIYRPWVLLNTLPGEDDRDKLSPIFCSGPAWLLKFTSVERDAALLGFELPDLSSAPELGRDARADRDRWPMLPRGTIDAGGPCDDPDPYLTSEELLMRIYPEPPPVVVRRVR